LPKTTDQPGSTPPLGAPEPAKKPTIIIHVPDPVNKPDWIDELKKKLPGGFDAKLTPKQIKLFTPTVGINIVFHAGVKDQVDAIEKQIHEIKELETIKVSNQLKAKTDLLSDADILIVGAVNIYKHK
jgi:hypothetical protein